MTNTYEVTVKTYNLLKYGFNITSWEQAVDRIGYELVIDYHSRGMLRYDGA